MQHKKRIFKTLDIFVATFGWGQRLKNDCESQSKSPCTVNKKQYEWSCSFLLDGSTFGSCGQFDRVFFPWYFAHVMMPNWTNIYGYFQSHKILAGHEYDLCVNFPLFKYPILTNTHEWGHLRFGARMFSLTSLSNFDFYVWHFQRSWSISVLQISYWSMSAILCKRSLKHLEARRYQQSMRPKCWRARAPSLVCSLAKVNMTCLALFGIGYWFTYDDNSQIPAFSRRNIPTTFGRLQQQLLMCKESMAWASKEATALCDTIYWVRKVLRNSVSLDQSSSDLSSRNLLRPLAMCLQSSVAALHWVIGTQAGLFAWPGWKGTSG
jgi:hypothetical protein